MSSSLYYTIPTSGKSLSYSIKLFVKANWQLPRLFDQSDIQFLKGAVAGGNTEMQTLIDLIEKHGEIFIEEKW